MGKGMLESSPRKGIQWCYQAKFLSTVASRGMSFSRRKWWCATGAKHRTNKKFKAIIKELFIRCRKLNISIVFITQSYFSVPKEVRLNSTRYLIMKIHNKKELKNIAITHSADIDYKDFMKTYRECTSEPCSFLTVNTTLPALNS